MDTGDSESEKLKPYEQSYRIGDFHFGETTERPFIRRRGEPLHLQGRTMLEVIPEEHTLEQAKALVPFPVLLPQWLPQGFDQESFVQVSRPPRITANTGPSLVPTIQSFRSSVHVLWHNIDGGYIALDIAAALPHSTQQLHSLYAGIDTLSEVQVNRQPAALIFRAEGSTPELRAVFPRASMRLLWQTDTVAYELRGSGEHVSTEELIQVAESMPSSNT